MTQPTKSKLNVGSGKSTILYPQLRETHWNVDVRQYEGTDEIGDMRTVEYPPESFIEILCSDCIDHVTFVEAKRVLRKFYGWLKPNGALKIHTPNLRVLARILSVRDNEEALTWIYGSNGEGDTNYESNVIRWSYSRESLTQLLTSQGFQVVSDFEDCNGFGLSVVAVKR